MKFIVYLALGPVLGLALQPATIAITRRYGVEDKFLPILGMWLLLYLASALPVTWVFLLDHGWPLFNWDEPAPSPEPLTFDRVARFSFAVTLLYAPIAIPTVFLAAFVTRHFAKQRKDSPQVERADVTPDPAEF